MFRRPLPLALTLAFAFAACGCGGSAGGDETATEAGTGGRDGSASDAGADRAVGPVPDAGGSGDGPQDDGPASDDATVGGDGPTGDASGADSTSDAGCAPPTGGAFPCGRSSCEGTTSYCLAGMLHDSCEPLPPECACAGSLDCACLLAHVENPCDAGSLTCKPMHDGGLYWIQALLCP